MKTRLINKIGLIPVMLFIMLNMISAGAYAQYVIKAADQQFEHYNYSEAVKEYLKAWKKKERPYTAQKIADSYRKMSNYKEAEDWYARLSAMPGSSPESKLWYAEALRSQGKYTEAKIQYQQYAEQQTTVSPEIQMWISSCDSAVAWIAAPKRVKIENQSNLNGEYADWAAVKYAEGIVFTSDRVSDLAKGTKRKRPFLKFDGVRMPDKQIYHWTGNPYMRLYYSKDNKISLFPLGTANDYHTGTVSFTADGKEAFFTMAGRSDKKDFKQVINTIYTGLYSSRLVDGKWTDPEPFRYTNVAKWSAGDPCISADGQTLFFVSDMPGGEGGTDIYKCTREPDGKWSDAVSPGTGINSSGNERSPSFYHGELFFSSDGHLGMGGLDAYKTSGSQSEKVINLGYPMNSAKDDFAICLTGESAGFISSNRDNGAGMDDIYSFAILPEKEVIPVAAVPVITEKVRDSIYIKNIYYNFNKSDIRDDAALTLHKIFSLMKQNPDAKLVMGAHTDSKGTEDYNLRLSQQRAAEAARYFIERGIDPSRISTKGYGESIPAAPNTLQDHKDNPAGRQLNRRTEIKLTLQLN